MSRVPYAAKTLVDQVGRKYRRVSLVGSADPDGLGVVRTIAFTGPAAKYLGEVLPHLGDPRVVKWEQDGKTLHVTFSPRTIADDRTAFALDAAEQVGKAEEPQEVSDGNEEGDGEGDVDVPSE